MKSLYQIKYWMSNKLNLFFLYLKLYFEFVIFEIYNNKFIKE